MKAAGIRFKTEQTTARSFLAGTGRNRVAWSSVIVRLHSSFDRAALGSRHVLPPRVKAGKSRQIAADGKAGSGVIRLREDQGTAGISQPMGHEFCGPESMPIPRQCSALPDGRHHPS